jgi:hypothetical protein
MKFTMKFCPDHTFLKRNSIAYYPHISVLIKGKITELDVKVFKNRTLSTEKLTVAGSAELVD